MAAAQAPATLRAEPSSRATTEVRLAYPTTQPMMAMPGMPATQAEPAKTFVIAIDYGQPHLRGRTLHTDSLVPYDKAWRTGASASTTLTTDVDLVLGSVMVLKGKYVLYTVPSRAGWQLIVQKSVGQSAMRYDAANDLTRVNLRLTPLPSPAESLTMWLIPSLEPGPAHGELRFAWGADQLSVDWSVKQAP